jgi:hypothetical protein
METLAYILWGIGGFCVLGAISERKDLMRFISFLAVALIFGIIGMVLSRA